MARERAARRGLPQTMLPLRTNRAFNAVSCWYCDAKIYVFNNHLFSFGRRYARFLKVWFTVGTVLSCVALAGVSLMLLWNFINILHSYKVELRFDNHSMRLLFGSLLPKMSLSIMDTIVIVLSTLVSVSFHEVGHAVAAASEGLALEYIAIFLAILFPGALVAFDYHWLKSLPHFAALRIYCAGIWHNLIFCAACALTLLALPMMLHPLYMHHEGPLVLDVSEAFVMPGYLSPGDVIVAVDGTTIKDPHDWMTKMSEIKSQLLPKLNTEHTHSFENLTRNKGYCVPVVAIKESRNSKITNDQSSYLTSSCPDELSVFMSISCSNSSLPFEGNHLENEMTNSVDEQCLISREVVKLQKCGNGWNFTAEETNCGCSEEELCMAPLEIPQMAWVEITYSTPYSSKFSNHIRNESAYDIDVDSKSTACGGSFVYVGDLDSLAQSIQLSAYRPKWASMIALVSIPYILEKVLVYSFHVSASLVLLNVLPVYFLDGESILDTIICLITLLRRRQQQKVVRCFLIAGTILSIIFVLQIVYSIYSSS